jgi:hypothetical protein
LPSPELWITLRSFLQAERLRRKNQTLPMKAKTETPNRSNVEAAPLVSKLEKQKVLSGRKRAGQDLS